MTPETLVILVGCLCLLFVFAAILMKWREEIQAAREKEARKNAELAKQRMIFIGQCLTTLRAARDYIYIYSTEHSGRTDILEKIGKIVNRKENNTNELY